MKHYLISETGAIVWKGKLPKKEERQLLKVFGFKICTQEEYLEKRKQQQKEDAKVAKETDL